MKFSDIQNIVPEGQMNLVNDTELSYLITDSRQIHQVQTGTLFFAIKGKNHDGHDYIPNLYDMGVRHFVVDSSYETMSSYQASFFYTENVICLLQALCTVHRDRFDLPVIGITGSNGKTIVKEWLYHLLAVDMSVVKNPKSYNSQIGVPLSVWQTNAQHKMGIFEAGISTVGEMQTLASVIKPSIGIFTNIGTAHDEGFHNRIEKIREKLTLFENSEVVIYCKDHSPLAKEMSHSGIPSFSWSTSKGADILLSITTQPVSSLLSVSYQHNTFDCKLPFTDQASIENVMHCIAMMLYLSYDTSVIKARLRGLPTIKMRLELKPGINACQIIDDTYNNDLAGLEVALGFLSQQSSLKKTLILSDILQSGIDQDTLYQKVSGLITSYGVSKFIGIGEELSSHHSLFPDSSLLFEDTQSLLRALDGLKFDKEVILVKGARSFRFEQIISKLAQKTHRTVLEIDLNALTHNLNYYRSKLQKNTLLMVMVKAMAYGTGSDEIAHLLVHHQVDYLSVAYVDEGIALRKSGIHIPIMVMNISVYDFENVTEYNLEPEIYSLELLLAYIHHLNGKNSAIHLKIDTGMKRLGFQPGDIDQLIALLQANPNIEVKSIFSHLAGSDDAIHDEFSKQQVDVLNIAYDKISASLMINPLKHILNSSGILRFPAYHFDMVRLGIGLYGIDSNRMYQEQLRPISSLKTTISQINHVRQGETIGYGRKGKAHQDLTIATIAIGYADGFSRAFGNGVGQVVVNGQLAAVTGNVCMDMTMIDISHIKASVGDEVVIFGNQMPITTLAKKLNTIPYEVLTSVSERVKRVYFQD